MPAASKWDKEIAALSSDDYKFAVPYHVVLGEAVDAAKFLEAHWSAQRDASGKEVPGLQAVARKSGPSISQATAEEIYSLVDEIQAAHLVFLKAAEPVLPDAQLARASALVAELSAALDFLFDDGVEDERDAQLERVKQSHADDPASFDALATELADYAGLAETYRAQLKELGTFDIAAIDEALALSRELLSRPQRRAAPTDGERRALARRNRLLQLLGQRVALIRSAARFVYRHDPARVRLVTSAYERRRRAAARRVKKPANG